MTGKIEESLATGVRFLTSVQEADGRWIDYRLPVGSSDAWMTGYTSVALVAASAAVPAEPALEAARRGASWLARSRSYDAGWGFNRWTGPDADSTAWALLALDGSGFDIDAQDVGFLLAHWTAAGGVATYRHGPAHWADPHPDVTPVALLALPANVAREVAEVTLDYLAGVRLDDGSWPSYWWTTGHYSTLRNLEVRAAFGRLGRDELPVVSELPSNRVCTPFDLACIVETAALVGAVSLAGPLADELAALQHESGDWSPSIALRVTDADADRPRGRVYPDIRGIHTTATAVRALSRCLG
jgi:hypothetical protein